MSFLNLDYPNTTDFSPVIDLKCEKYWDNTTNGLIIKEYNGIPENLLFNVIGWSLLVVLFTFLRRIGDYGRFGLIKRDNDEERIQTVKTTDLTWNSLFTQVGDENPDRHYINNTYTDNHLGSWILNMFRLKDKHIFEKCGKDALYYILFQRYIIAYLAIVTVFSISIILPINLSGKIISDKKIFASTSILNVEHNSPVLWAHLILSWVYLILCFVFMRLFSKRMQYVEADYVSRTVMIFDIPKDRCVTELFYTHFSESHSDLVITDIQFAYDISELAEIDQKKRAMTAGKAASLNIYQTTNVRPQMHPFHCGSLFELCCCLCKKQFYTTDAIEYYTDRENHYRQQLAEAKEVAYNNPLGICFITFKDEEMATTFLKEYQVRVCRAYLCCCCSERRPYRSSSSVSHILRAEDWLIKYAPSPNNIKWENLSQTNLMWKVRWFVINFVLLIVMLFFTTPSILIETFSRWSHVFRIDSFRSILPEFIVDILPSLLLRIFTALIPVVVGWTALIEKHWTRSGENHSMMLKTFIVLLFMVLILPTFGLTSIEKFFVFWMDRKDNDNLKWKCIADNGAFFVKYITTCSLIGTALDLLRLPELLLYVLKLLWARSLSERVAVRAQAAYEFEYGVQYAWILTVFTVTICFSVVCPFITPFGLIYLLLKHLVDRYNIYFAYVYTKVDKKIHKRAVSFSIASLILLQFSILFFILMNDRKTDSMNVMTIIQILVICLALLLFCGHGFFGWFKKLSLFNPKTTIVDTTQASNTRADNFDDSVNENTMTPAPSQQNIELKSPFMPGLLRSVSSANTAGLAENQSEVIRNQAESSDNNESSTEVNETDATTNTNYGSVNANL